MVVEPLLYENITCGHTRSAATTRLIFQTLASRPDLAQAVVKISGFINPRYLPPGLSRRFGCLGVRPRNRGYAEAEKARTAHVQNIVATLGQAKKIRYLDIRDSYGGPAGSIASAIAPAVAAMNLREFVVWGRCWTSDIVPILRPQTNLISLHLTSGPWNLEGILATDVPHLSSLVAPLRDAARLVPGRPITRLQLTTAKYSTPTKGEREAQYSRLCLSTSLVTEFTMPVQWPDEESDLEELGDHIAQYLPAIEVLALQGTQNLASQLTPELVSS